MVRKDGDKNYVSSENQKPLKVDAMESFMNDVFENHLVAKNHLDTKINWLMGVSGLTMSLLIPYIHSVNPEIDTLGLFIVLFSSMIAFFICLLSLQVPKLLNKHKSEARSVMFFSRSVKYTPDYIYTELKDIKDYDDVLKQYSMVLYNLIERNIKIKDLLFRTSVYTLLVGLSLGFIIMVFTV
ncbi:MAG: hypothetical protein ACP5NW_02680 [Candidatus Woesearchaeota archaeon]